MLAVLVWAAIEQFDVPAREMLDIFLAALLVVGLVIVAAAITVALWAGLRRLLKKD